MKTNYEQMGIAAMLPGMQHMLDLMQAELDGMRERLAVKQNGTGPNGTASKFDAWAKLSPTDREKRRKHLSEVKRGLKPSKAVSGLVNGWPADPEARKIEAKRRMGKRLEKLTVEERRARTAKARAALAAKKAAAV